MQRRPIDKFPPKKSRMKLVGAGEDGNQCVEWNVLLLLLLNDDKRMRINVK